MPELKRSSPQSLTRKTPTRQPTPGKEALEKRPMPKAERRRQLLKIAYEIIAEDGAGALNMSVLAERSGASKPIVYEHFKNSDEVIFCLIDEYFENMSRFVLERNADLNTLDEFLEASVDAMFEFHAREKFNIKRITNGFSTHERTNNLFFDYIKRSVSFFKILLDQQGVEKQKLDIAANMLFEMILSTVSDYAVKKNAETAKIVLKQAVNGFVHSLVKSELQKPIAPTKVLKLKS